MSKLYVVGIMGAGRMAQGFDHPGDGQVLTLAHAACDSPAFRLGGFFDLDPQRAEAAERKWGCPASPRDRTAWLDQLWDVVCIATPDAQHGADFRDALARKPKAIVMEKPVATEPAEALRLLQEAQRLGVPVLVDFPRRWHTAVSAVAEHIKDGHLGKPVAAVLVYSGESAHSATHMLDLFQTWWGGRWEPAFQSRQGVVTCLTFRDSEDAVTVSFVSFPAEPYYVWEMHVYCEKGKLELSHSPEVLELSVPMVHPVYSSHHVLTPLRRFEMENEPLLPRLMETLAEMIADSRASHALVQHEIDSQTFIGRVLSCLEAAQHSLIR